MYARRLNRCTSEAPAPASQRASEGASGRRATTTRRALVTTRSTSATPVCSIGWLPTRRPISFSNQGQVLGGMISARCSFIQPSQPIVSMVGTMPRKAGSSRVAGAPGHRPACHRRGRPRRPPQRLRRPARAAHRPRGGCRPAPGSGGRGRTGEEQPRWGSGIERRAGADRRGRNAMPAPTIGAWKRKPASKPGMSTS